MANEVLLVSITREELKEVIKSTVITVLNQHTTDKSQSELLSVNDLANFLDVSVVTIHNWKKKGLIPFQRISRRIYFKREEVLNSLEEGLIG